MRHPAWHRAAGLGVPGSKRLGRDDGARSGSDVLLHGWQSPGCSSFTGRAWAMARFVLGPKWPGQFSKTWWVSSSLRVFQGIYGGVTEITLGISAVPAPVPHIHMDGDGHLQPQLMLLAKEEPTAESRAGLWCGCWYFRCDFRWTGVNLG